MSTDDSATAVAPGPATQVAELLDSMNAVSRRLGRKVARKEKGFSLGTWLLLRRLAEPSPVQPVAIARLSGVSRQRVQKQIAAFAEQGLVTAQDDPADERRKLVSLTEAGRAHLAKLDAVVEGETGDLSKDLIERALMPLRRLAGGKAAGPRKHKAVSPGAAQGKTVAERRAARSGKRGAKAAARGAAKAEGGAK